jgi:hypothetical protein
MKKKRIPKSSKSGLDEYFLVLRENGRVEVKDGRTLEEYINDPRLVKRRKSQLGLEFEMVLCDRHTFEWGIIPRTA